MMKTVRPGSAYIHARALSDRLQTLQNGNRFGIVVMTGSIRVLIIFFLYFSHFLYLNKKKKRPFATRKLHQNRTLKTTNFCLKNGLTKPYTGHSYHYLNIYEPDQQCSRNVYKFWRYADVRGIFS